MELSQLKMLKFKLNKWLLFFVFFFVILPSYPQCAMCRAALESEEGGAKAEAINDGIVFLMVIPYILVALAGYGIYKIKYGKRKNIDG